MLAAVCFAFLTVIVVLAMMRCFVGCVVWGMTIGVVLGFVGFGIIFLYNAGIGVFANRLGYLGMPTLNGTISNTQYYQIYAYICFSFAGLMLLLLFCYFPKLKPTILACRVANQYLTQVPHIYLLATLLSILLLAMWACCILSMVYLFSTATFVVGSDQDVFTSVQSYAQHGLVLLYYLIFGAIWTSAVIKGVAVFVVACSCCAWYYGRGANT